jgi:hypothetical protein
VEVFVIADLDTLLIALYVELTDRVIPAVGPRRRGPGRPLEVTDAELVCLAVAQVLLRYNDERHWLRAAADRVGHLFGIPTEPPGSPSATRDGGGRSVPAGQQVEVEDHEQIVERVFASCASTSSTTIAIVPPWPRLVGP